MVHQVILESFTFNSSKINKYLYIVLALFHNILVDGSKLNATVNANTEVLCTKVI